MGLVAEDDTDWPTISFMATLAVGHHSIGCIAGHHGHTLTVFISDSSSVRGDIYVLCVLYKAIIQTHSLWSIALRV